MTTELEEQFFKVFGIEKIECCKHFKYFDSKCDRLDSTEKCLDCIGTNKVYPKITDRKLLQMICTLNKEAIYGYSDWGGNFVIGETVEELKESILTDCIRNKSKIFNQIRQLFKEGE